MRIILLKDADKEKAKYANTLLDVARISILKVIATNPDSDTYEIIKKTGISEASVYREVKMLKDAGIINWIGIPTKSRFNKKLYRMRYNRISFVIDRNGIKVSVT